jgi:predicted phosphodiesterase
VIRRLGIIGDLHGEHRRLAILLEWFTGMRVDALLCTGDLADGRGCLNLSCELLREAEVQTVAGNHDRWLLEERVRHLENAHCRGDLTDENLEYLESLPRWRRIETVAGAVLLCHGILDHDLARVWPGRDPSEIRRSRALDDLLEESDYRFLINGHMHFRMLMDFESLTLINAGTVMGDRAGALILDFEKGDICVYDVKDGRPPREHLATGLSPGPDRPVWRNTSEFDGTRAPYLLYAK